MGKHRKIVNYENSGVMKLLILAYLSMMLGVFPLYFLHQYEGIGSLKYTLFFTSSLVFIGFSLPVITIRVLGVLKGKTPHPNLISPKGKRVYKLKFSFLDKAMLAYGGCVLLSFIFSDFKEFAIKGADGWQMGLVSQLLFLILYGILSRYPTWNRLVLITHFIASGFVFLLGILHRFSVDPLGMYPGLTLLQKQEFLSTIGQATWYSSYVCTVFPLGIITFYFAKTMLTQLGASLYLILAFGTLVTQNSDSAFLGIGILLLVLGSFSLRKAVYLIRFWQLMSVLWGTFGGMGILQRIWQDRMIPLDSLSLFFSQSSFTWIVFAFSVMVSLLLEKQGKDRIETKLELGRKIYQGLVVSLGIGAILLLLFIVLNTKGYWQEWFGVVVDHPYLLFDHRWGNNRGSSWMLTWQQFGELSFLHQCFGVGPDSFSAHLYQIEEVRNYLRSLWGNLTLTNAHNEYLNHLFCYGIFGLLGWLSVLWGGVLYFYRRSWDRPELIGFALCLAAYSAHNLFCYQQVCCTPFIFLLAGLGESLTKWGKSPTIIKNR